MLLSKRIKNIRKFKNITQLEMSDRIGISQSTYNGYETEAGNLTFNTILKVAEALDCNIHFLIDVTSDCYNEKEWVLKLPIKN